MLKTSAKEEFLSVQDISAHWLEKCADRLHLWADISGITLCLWCFIVLLYVLRPLWEDSNRKPMQSTPFYPSLEEVFAPFNVNSFIYIFGVS